MKKIKKIIRFILLVILIASLVFSILAFITGNFLNTAILLFIMSLIWDMSR